MFNLIKAIPISMGISAVICMGLCLTAIFGPETAAVGSAIVAGTFAFMFGTISYVGFKVRNHVNAATQTAYDVVGEHVEKVSDAIVERVKKN